MTGKGKRKLAMPDTLIIVASVVLLVAILSWIIPSGTYDYQEMNINGRIRNVAIDGTYHTIDKSEVTTTGFLGFFSVLYRGCVEAADVIFMILCCCGTFGVVVKTGAFHAGIGTILKKLKGKEILLVPIIMMIFGLGGSVFGMASEFYGFYPLIVGLGVALGYDAMFGFAIIAVGEFVGFMGATLNPYSVGIAQTISGVELYSGTGYRAICFVIFMAISIIYVMVYGRKIKKNPGASVVFGEKNIHAFDRDELNEYSFTLKDGLVLLDVLVVLVVLMLGLIKWGWDFPQLCGLFLLMSMIAAAICKWSPNKWCSEFIDSAKTAMWGCILTGIAKAIANYGYCYLRLVKRAEKCASCSFCTGNARSTDADQLLHSVCNRSGFCNHADHGTAGRYYWCEQTDSSSCIPVWRRTFQYFLADGRYRYHLWPGWNFLAEMV